MVEGTLTRFFVFPLDFRKAGALPCPFFCLPLYPLPLTFSQAGPFRPFAVFFSGEELVRYDAHPVLFSFWVFRLWQVLFFRAPVLWLFCSRPCCGLWCDQTVPLGPSAVLPFFPLVGAHIPPPVRNPPIEALLAPPVKVSVRLDID